MPANDDAYVWIGPLVGTWDTPGNWEDTTTGADPAPTSPGSTEIVTFNSPVSPPFPEPRQVQVIEGVGAAAAVTFNGDNAIAGTLDVGTLDLGGSLEVQAGATLQAATGLVGSGSLGLDVSGSGAAAYFGRLDLNATVVPLPATGSPAIPLDVANGAYVQAGSLVLDGTNGTVAIIIDATSTVELGSTGAAAAGALTIDPGHTLSARSAAINNVVNDGILQAQDLTINTLAGNGAVQVAQGGSLEITDAILGNQAITLAGYARLVLGGPGLISPSSGSISAASSITLAGSDDVVVFNAPPGTAEQAPISGFDGTDALIINAALTAATPTAGGLLLQDGTAVVGTFDLIGNYAGDNFLAVPVTDNAVTEIVLAPATLFAPPSGDTSGDSFVWNGPLAGDWNVAANWTDQTTGSTPAAAAPSANDTVIFNGSDGATQIIFGDGHAAAVTFDGDATIFDTLHAGTLTQTSGVLEVHAGATLQAGAALFGAETFDEAAGLTVSGAGATALFGTLEYDASFADPLQIADGGDVRAATLLLGGGRPVQLVIDSGSTLEVGSAGTAAAGVLTIDPGHTLIATASYSNTTVDNIIVNNGSLRAHDFAVEGLAGDGAVQVGAGGSLAVTGAILGDQAITLATGAQLFLGNAGAPTPNSQTLSATSTIWLTGSTDVLAFDSQPGSTALAPIIGFDATDTLFVAGTITAAAQTQAGLVLQDGTDTVGTIDLVGSYSGESFLAVPARIDSTQGTELLLFPATVAVQGGTVTVTPSAGATVSLGELSEDPATEPDPDGTLILNGDGTFEATGGIGFGNLVLNSGAMLSLPGTDVVDTNSVTGNPGSGQVGSGGVFGTVIDNGSITAAGGTLHYFDGVAGTGRLEIDSGATLRIDGGIAADLAIVFNPGTAETLILNSPGTVLTTSISGFAVGDRIAIGVDTTITAAERLGPDTLRLDIAQLGLDTMTYDLTDIALPSDAGFTVDTNTFGYVEIACYVEGTRIATDTGVRPIEALHVGDRLLLAYGGSRPVTWLGHRHVDCRRHPCPADVWPVRVRPGAFGPGRPHRDLLLSPDHAVFHAGVLIPVRHLVDGRAIAQMPRAAVTYWHVELDCHDVILAEGLPCESYLDTGQRSSFAGGDVLRLHPVFADRHAMTAHARDAGACAPLAVCGPAVEAAQALLRAWQPLATGRVRRR